MGCAPSTPESADSNTAANSKKIDKQIEIDRKNIDDSVRLLLLGPGESGKSTVLKQMKLLYNDGFSAQEVQVYRSAIFLNILQNCKVLIEAMRTSYDSIARRAKQKYKDIMVNGGQSGPVVDAAELLKNADTEMFGYNKDATLPQDIIRAIHLLWSDSGIQYCYKRANEYQLMDSCAYFMEALDHILVVRIMTVAVTETHFTLPTFKLTVYDVGGQRTERKKWAPYFDNAQAIIFVVAVGAFDQVCLEDSETNRLVESMNLFGSVCNHPLFKSTDMILFLNKIDILKEKLEKKKQVSTYFSGYSGDNSFESVSKYFTNRFLDLNKYPTSKQIYVHLTFATDVHTFRKVLASVQDSIFKNTLKEMDMM
ncbi:guanine nucleotide binding protein, alpha subunit [Rhizoclosmatium globosum]|uniref:Guanine nucleotide binding protein, alpha subunit n=1 Tax=Rhizoclosmatium globosum TaxID=329046 RepID=A0A1Y2BQ33_9FUNG|nr:guanine nucleotide binding protein, alpha subunit [Rhizoclosmatium globosum]|eukprot:ORY36852.1 guanine nucleotide binding protein, alpha subunit [Rhizoclosmatium globosum]